MRQIHADGYVERELSSFRPLRDNYPKMLITLDDERATSYDGIRRVYALDWLAEREPKR